MVSGIANLTIEQGADFSQTVAWTDNSGTPINITGYYAQIRIKPKAPTLPILFDSNSSNVVINGSAGTITINISNSVTKNYIWNDAAYQLEITSGSGFKTRLLEGNITCSLSRA